MPLSTALVLAAAAPAAGAGGLQDILQSPFLFLGVMVVLMYFLLLRPQQQQRSRHQQMIGGIKRGDTVVLSSGVIAQVTRVEDTEVTAEIAKGVEIKVLGTIS